MNSHNNDEFPYIYIYQKNQKKQICLKNKGAVGSVAGPIRSEETRSAGPSWRDQVISAGMLSFLLFINHTPQLPVGHIRQFFHHFPIIQVVPAFICLGNGKPLAAPYVQADQLVHFSGNTFS